MQVDFYHLARSPLEQVLPSICEKVLQSAERLLIVAPSDQLARIDEQLWTSAPDSFLPHGRDNVAGQPILLSEQPLPANGAANIALADGMWREEALGFGRAFYFFDDGMLDSARDTWRALKGRPDVEARYWKQDDRGKWVRGP